MTISRLAGQIYEEHMRRGPDAQIESWTITPYQALDLAQDVHRQHPEMGGAAAIFAMLEKGNQSCCGVRILVK